MTNSPEYVELFAILRSEEQRVRATFPLDRRIALIELTRSRDYYDFHRRRLHADDRTSADEVERSALYENGWNVALRLFHDESTRKSGAALSPSSHMSQEWADSVLQHCGRIGSVQRLLDLSQVELVRLQRRHPNDFVFSMSVSNAGQEAHDHADLEYVAEMTRRRDADRVRELVLKYPAIISRMSGLVSSWRDHYIQYSAHPELDAFYSERAFYEVRPYAPLGIDAFPPLCSFGGYPFALYAAAAVKISGFAYKHIDFAQILYEQQPTLDFRNLLTVPATKASLVESLASALDVDDDAASAALNVLTLDSSNSGDHTGNPASYLPSLIAVGNDTMIKSIAGATHPSSIQFVLHELRRRHPRDWDRAVEFREERFRDDFFQLFPHRSLLKLPGSVKIRENGRVVTDVDAVMIDAGTGTLGLFQFKWQDLFITDMRKWRAKKSNFISEGNRRVNAVFNWHSRRAPADVASSLGLSLPKGAEIRTVRLFVIGRLFSHFSGDAPLDSRAAWGTWPGVLRLCDELTDWGQPIDQLFDQLGKRSPVSIPTPSTRGQNIRLGKTTIVVEPVE